MRRLLEADAAAAYLEGADVNSTNFFYDTCGIFEYYLELLYKYYIPVMIFVGLIGNFLSCVVFLTTYLKMRSSSYYLAALAIADLAFLIVLTIVNCSFNGVLELFNKEGWCQILVYISSVASILSVWLIVAFTVERFIAVQYPLQRPSICTVSRSKMTVSVLSGIAIVSQCYVFWTAGIGKNETNEDTCSMIPEQLPAMKVINTIDCVITLIIPFVLIVVMNVMIARNLFKFSRKMRDSVVEECVSLEKSLDSKESSKQLQTSTRRKPGPHSSSRKSFPTRNSNKPVSNQIEQLPCIQTKVPGLMSAKTQQSISKMLLLVSTVFIMLNLPSYAARLYIYFYKSVWDLDAPATIYCVQQFAMILFYTNYSINFSLYAMYGVTFRRCLWQLIRNNLKKLSRRPCLCKCEQNYYERKMELQLVCYPGQEHRRSCKSFLIPYQPPTGQKFMTMMDTYKEIFQDSDTVEEGGKTELNLLRNFYRKAEASGRRPSREIYEVTNKR